MHGPYEFGGIHPPMLVSSDDRFLIQRSASGCHFPTEPATRFHQQFTEWPAISGCTQSSDCCRSEEWRREDEDFEGKKGRKEVGKAGSEKER